MGKHISFLLVLALLGCNSDTSENQNVSDIPTVQHLHAFSGISSVRLNQTEQIDLSPFIIKSTSENVEITHFDNLNPSECPDIAPANLGFEINSDTLGRCDYRYHVTNNANEKDSARYSVLTSNEPLAIQKTINLSEKLGSEISIDLHAELGLTGYEINPDTLVSQFSPTIASVESNFNPEVVNFSQIQLALVNKIGWFYIYYTLRPETENGVVSADSKAGYIFVNITDNDAPKILAPQCIVKEEVNSKNKVTIDLEKVFVADKALVEESGNWQLSYVFSPSGASVQASEPEDVLNKSFTFIGKEVRYPTFF